MGKRRAHVEERLISDATHRARTVSRIVKSWPKVSRSATGATRSTILGVGSSPLTPWTWILRCFARPGTSLPVQKGGGEGFEPPGLGPRLFKRHLDRFTVLQPVPKFASTCTNVPSVPHRLRGFVGSCSPRSSPDCGLLLRRTGCSFRSSLLLERPFRFAVGGPSCAERQFARHRFAFLIAESALDRNRQETQPRANR